MASEYDPTTIDSVEKDWVRFQTGDRGPTVGSRAFILDDDEILAMLTQERNKWMAAFRCGSIILARGFGLTSKSVDGLSISFGDGAESNYRKHLETLRRRGVELQLTVKPFEMLFIP